ncbi:MFS transporter [Arsenicicoccus sp. UBA7492]|uniref:MFS transporter n=1 Tax=Arsenicicoccus sp. UBA7492 TaxID=1946057 RepID=UPI00257AD8F2|nr:MFS transporter [Arsenicicoccus sp. UBA7492]
MTTQPVPARRGLHPAWIVAVVTLGALVAGAAFRSSTGVLLEPIEREFGWSRATTSGAVSLNLVLYGVVAPFAAALMESWGVRKVVTVALAVVGIASGMTIVMTQPWQLWLLWGLLIGTGTGAMALVLGAIVANRWFDKRRGLVTGLFSAANATGQLIFLPLIAAAAEGPGWRYAAGVTAVLALLMAALVAVFLRDRPADIGALPYGATEPPPPEVRRYANPASQALAVLRRASRTWPFWALVLTFFVCGWSTNGLVQTHFVSAAHDHGMPATTAAGLLAVVGIFDLVGTVASGWLTDRMDSRYLLAAVFYGLDWVATVPPTVALCRQFYGIEDSGVVFGWTYASHMIGAGVGASVAGGIREATGSYHGAWIVAAGLCVVACVCALTIPRRGAPVRFEMAMEPSDP